MLEHPAEMESSLEPNDEKDGLVRRLRAAARPRAYAVHDSGFRTRKLGLGWFVPLVGTGVDPVTARFQIDDRKANVS